MPALPDGSFVWLQMNGQPLIEYAHEVEIDDKRGTHTINVYVAAKKGPFEVWYNLGKPHHSHRQVKIHVDGHLARRQDYQPPFWDDKISYDGWLVGPVTTYGFTFAKLDVNPASSEDNKARLAQSCIQVSIVDCVVRTQARLRCVTFVQPKIARAVHPESDVVSSVGCQVKPGKLMTRFTTPFESIKRQWDSKVTKGAPVYSVKFLYRAEEFLVNEGVMPQTDVAVSSQNDDYTITESIRAEVPAEGARSKQEREQKLEKDLLAIKQMSDSLMDVSVD